MIEVKPEKNEEDDDLFTEPADKEPRNNAQSSPNDPAFEIPPILISNFYHSLRKRRVPKDVARELTDLYLNFILEYVLGLGR